MVFLGLDFIISSTIWIIAAFSLLYYFRREVFKFHYEKSDSLLSSTKIKQYLNLNYPKIKFHYKALDEIKKQRKFRSRNCIKYW